MIVKDDNVIVSCLIKVIVYYNDYNYWDFGNNTCVLGYDFIIRVFEYNIKFRFIIVR